MIENQVRHFKRRSKKIWLPVLKDISGNPITTSNGLAPVRQQWEQVSIAIIQCVIYKPTFTDADYYAQFNALNSTGWRSFPRYHAWVAEVHTDERTIADNNGAAQTGHDVHYCIWGTDRHGGWRFTHPDAAYVYRDGTSFSGFVAGNVPYFGNLDGSGGEGSTLLLPQFDTKKEINFSTTLGF